MTTIPPSAEQAIAGDAVSPPANQAIRAAQSDAALVLATIAHLETAIDSATLTVLSPTPLPLTGTLVAAGTVQGDGTCQAQASFKLTGTQTAALPLGPIPFRLDAAIGADVFRVCTGTLTVTA